MADLRSATSTIRIDIRTEDADGRETESSESKNAGRRRRLFAIAGSLLLAVVLVGSALASGLGLRTALPGLVGLALPEDWEIEIGDAGGSWFSPVLVEDVVVTAPEGSLRVDSLILRYRLLPLLRKRVEVEELRLERPFLRLEAASGEPPAESEREEEGEGEETGGWTIVLARGSIDRGGARIATKAGAFGADAVALGLSGTLAGGRVDVRLDTLGARLDPPDLEGVAHFGASGSFRDGVLTVADLNLASERSDVRGRGRLALPKSDRLPEDVDFELSARPLDLRDLPLGWEAESSRVRLDLRAEGGADSVTLRLVGEGPGPASLTITSVARARSAVRGSDAESPTRLSVTADGSSLPLDLARPLEGPRWSGGLRLDADRLEATSPYRLAARVRYEPVAGPAARSERTPAPGPATGPAYSRPGALERPISVALDATGRGWSPDSATLEATLRLSQDGARDESEDTWAGIRGEVEAELSEGVLEWRGEIGLDSASLEGSGSASVDGRGIDIEVPRLALGRVDLSRLDASWPATRLTGGLRADVAGNDLAALDGTAAVWLTDWSVPGISGDSLGFRGDIENGRLSGTLGGRLLGGTVATTVAARPFEEELGVEWEGRFSGLGRGEGSPPLRLAGRLEGDWSGSADGPRASLGVRLDSSTVGGVTIPSGTADLELQGERLEADLRLAVGDGGRVAAEGFTTLGTRPRIRLEEARFVSIPPSLFGELERGGALSGGARLELDGLAPDELVGSGELWLEPSRFAEGRLDSARVEVAADSGRWRLDGFLQPADGGRLAVSGRGTPDGAFDGTLGGHWPRAGGFLGQPPEALGADSIGVRVRRAEPGAGPATVEWAVVIRDGRFRELEIDSLLSRGDRDSTGLRVDTLRASSNVLTLAGSGSLPASGPGRGRIVVEGEITDLTPLRGLLGTETLDLARGNVALELEGALDSLTADLAIDVAALAYRNVRFEAVELASQVTYVSAPEATRPELFGSADLSLHRILLEDAEVRDVAVHARGGIDSLRVTATANVDDLRRGELVLAVDPRPERRTVLVENLELQLDRDRWRLVSPSLIRYGDGVLIDSFAVAAGTQRIVVDGGVDGAGNLRLDARVDSTDIGIVSDLVGLPDLQGWLAAEARLRGSTTDPEGSLRVEAGLRDEDSAAGTADLTVRSDGRTFTVEGRLAHPAGGPLTLDGTGPARALGVGRADTTGFAPGGPEFGLALGAADFPVAWFDPLVDDATLSDLRGTLSADLRVSGTAADPLLEGPMELRSGSAEVPALGLEWNPIRIEAHGDGSRLVIDRAALGTGSGEARATGAVGWAELSRAPLDLEVVLDGFRAIHTFAYQARVSGEIDVGGRLDRPSLDGLIDVRSLDIYLDERVANEGLEDVTLTEEDLAMLRERFGYIPDDSVGAPLGQRVSGDLRIVLGRDSWLRNRESPEMAVAFTGELDVRLRPGEPTLAEGTIEIIPRRGFVQQFGRRFELGDGTVVLDGPPESARLDLVATYTIPSRANPDAAEVTIILGIEGTRDELELTLSSEPPMDNADIVSYIATGRPASGFASFEGSDSGGGLVAAGAGIALDRMVGVVEAAAAENIGLDVVEIRREGVREATLVAGKYVSPRVYLGFAQPVSLREGDGLSVGGEGQSEIEIEYAAYRWLLLNFEGSGSSVSFFLRARRAY